MGTISGIIGLILAVIALFISLFFAWRTFWPDIQLYIHNKNGVKSVDNLDLTMEEKLEDFNFFYDTVINSVPMIEEYEEAYGFSFRDRKEVYEELVKGTENDFEFYCIMSAISQEIPSFHTDLVYPVEINGLHCYNIKNVKADKEVLQCNQYWKKLIEDEAKKYREMSDNSYYCFSYVDGKYLYHSQDSIRSDWNEQYTLVGVNDFDVDTYIKDNIFIFNLYYDGKNEKPCRTCVVFNDRNGEKVSLKLQNKNGEIVYKDAYYDICEELKFLYMDIDEIDYVEAFDESDEISVYETDEVSYVKIDGMSVSNGKDIRSRLLNLKNENVIIDLRDNYGGNVEFAATYIYPELFNKDFDTSSNWYVPASDTNKIVYNDFWNRVISKLKKTEDSPYSSDKQAKSYVGIAKQSYRGTAKNSKNVAFLVSQRTGSAADRFVSDVKNNELGVVIGNNTGGEGLMNSFMAHELPNSKLVFVYMPGGALNPDGSDNSVYGTSPDIYVMQSDDDFYTQLSLLEDGVDISDFNEKLKYDTVLKYTMEYLLQ